MLPGVAIGRADRVFKVGPQPFGVALGAVLPEEGADGALQRAVKPAAAFVVADAGAMVAIPAAKLLRPRRCRPAMRPVPASSR